MFKCILVSATKKQIIARPTSILKFNDKMQIKIQRDALNTIGFFSFLELRLFFNTIRLQDLFRSDRFENIDYGLVLT